MGLFRTVESPSDLRAAAEGSVGGRNHAQPVSETQTTASNMGNVFMAPTVETNATSLARFNLELFKAFHLHRRPVLFRSRRNLSLTH